MERYEYLNGPPAPRMVAELAMRHDALVKQLANAQATIAALQARVQELGDGCEMMTHTAGTFQELWRTACDQREAFEQQLTQRTAELEAATRERDEAAKDRDDWITSWRALQRHNERIEAELERVRDQFADLRKMVAALPKVEGEIEVSSGVYNFILLKHDSGTRFLCGQIETEHTARAIAALWQHRQGMEG